MICDQETYENYSRVVREEGTSRDWSWADIIDNVGDSLLCLFYFYAYKYTGKPMF